MASSLAWPDLVWPCLAWSGLALLCQTTSAVSPPGFAFQHPPEERRCSDTRETHRHAPFPPSLSLPSAPQRGSQASGRPEKKGKYY
ncbi:hypothetical protein E2C01_041450 [Portunus trituberculatus]|uniref:Uncharacterized protein n=1 Tax=Portunus trituberculatus TaxID=210409 RepID=A0A5B7FQF8_PORTR|nr:hypothetical protein [Portunus trituberculatus]